ncbi:MAG: putative zinc-binding protein [Methanomassiliicoccales archaeon]
MQETLKKAHKKILLISCSGASNTGTMSDHAVRELVLEHLDDYQLLCLPALGLRRKTALENLKSADFVVVLDGCSMKCASEILQKRERSPDVSIELTKDCGIKKNMTPDFNKKEVERIKRRVIEEIERRWYDKIIV